MEVSAQNPSAALRFWRKNRVSIIFPVLAIASIYADWNHNQKYKAQKALIAKKLAEDFKD